MKRLFTILIPNYNGDQFIARCIESAQKQTYTNLEIIVIDGKSTDNSHRIVDTMRLSDPRIRRISTPVDHGLSDAVNIGIQAAVGDYALWLGNDDYLVDNRVLEDADTFLTQYSITTGINPVICYGGYKIHWTESGQFENRSKRDLDYHLMWFTDSIMCGNVFFSPRFCKQHGIRLKDKLRYCMDYDLWLQMIEKTTDRRQTACLTDRFVHVFTMRSDNITGGNIYKSTREALGVALAHTRNPLKWVGIYAFIGFQLGFQKTRELYFGAQTHFSSR
ncbi:glycosyltransferase [Spirosoma sp. KUDC1026]|uniref:glycosyltransferase n=1 Tax=Spirosoma sp. KUDC1026 TaxID=2745947 RepID=UPI00159BE1E3|nr:glycosyltransferase [Spirosoma sp. KUDC1026]QKZ11539.1 glycosyltransferase [Spirosoma sp. KUDC1026]